jgi:hypothetical protein
LDIKNKIDPKNNKAEVKLKDFPIIEYKLENKTIKYELKNSTTLSSTEEEY